MKPTPEMIQAALAEISVLASQKINRLNNGGCGVFAAAVVRRLENMGVTGFKIRTYGLRPEVNVADVERKLKRHDDMSAWFQNGVNFYHVVIEWDDKIYDSNGLREHEPRYLGFYPMQPGDISEKAMRTLSAKGRNWNPSFDRRQIPTLRKILNNAFRKMRRKMQKESRELVPA